MLCVCVCVMALSSTTRRWNQTILLQQQSETQVGKVLYVARARGRPDCSQVSFDLRNTALSLKLHAYASICHRL